MSQNDSTAGSQRWRGALMTVVRILLWLVLVFLVIVLLFLGYTWIEQQVVAPAQRSAGQVSALSTQAAQDSGRLNELVSRVAALESHFQQAQEDISGAQAELGDVQAQVDLQAGSLEAIEDLEARLAELEEELAQTGSSVTQVQGYLFATQSPLHLLQTDVDLLKVMQLLNRSRLYLNQNNYGLARDQVVLARELLIALEPQAVDFQRPVVAAWIQRLDLALANLPDYPVLAADDLEIAWQMILPGLPVSPGETAVPQQERTFSPTPPPTATPTPAAATPTPAPTL